MWQVNLRRWNKNPLFNGNAGTQVRCHQRIGGWQSYLNDGFEPSLQITVLFVVTVYENQTLFVCPLAHQWIHMTLSRCHNYGFKLFCHNPYVVLYFWVTSAHQIIQQGDSLRLICSTFPHVLVTLPSYWSDDCRKRNRDKSLQAELSRGGVCRMRMSIAPSEPVSQ